MSFRWILASIGLLTGALCLVDCGSASRDKEVSPAVEFPKGFAPNPLTAQNHPWGYGQKECFICHNVHLNLHYINPSISSADITAKAKEQGPTYCLTCHMGNGL